MNIAKNFVIGFNFQNDQDQQLIFFFGYLAIDLTISNKEKKILLLINVTFHSFIHSFITN